MLSVISSYVVTPAIYQGEPLLLSSLPSVCIQLRKRGFRHVDVLITSADIDVARGLKGAYSHREIADHIAQTIRKSVQFDGFPLLVPALATNFPNISNVSNSNARNRAVEDLAICLMVADQIHAKVVEVVCGRRIKIRKEDGCTKATISHPENENVVETIRQCFAESILEAFAKAKTGLGERYPRCAVALEMEPDILALARSPEDWRKVLDTLLAHIGRLPERDREELISRAGLNLDIGHLLVAQDRESPETRGQFLQNVLVFLGNYEQFIFHAHIGDHALGGHWVDAPLGRFHDTKDYVPLLKFYGELIRKFHAEPIVNSHPRYFTGTIAIELEACGEVGLVVETRDTLLRLCDKEKIQLDSDRNIADNIQRLISELPTEVLKEGWLEGINFTIFQAVQELVLEGEERSGNGQKVLSEEDLERIRRFLSAKGPDERTRRAMEVARLVLGRLGLEVLAEWLEDLNRSEYDRVFYRNYRDHTVHSVYVYLLGLYLYSVSSKIRQLVQSEDPRRWKPNVTDWFSRCWPAVALCHDIGYVFESEKEEIPQKALERLNEYAVHFISKVITFGTPEQRISEADEKGIVNYIGGEVCATIQDIKSIPTGDFFTSVGGLANQNATIPPRGLRNIFHLCAENKPNGKYGAGRSKFYDHGIMSAALVQRLTGIHSKWQTVLGEKVVPHIQAGPTLLPPIVNAIKGWVKARPASIFKPVEHTKPSELTQIEEAIALHNIYPEKQNQYPEGFLYSESIRQQFEQDANNKTGLDTFSIGVKDPLTFLLAICDSLQEWDRYAFASPLDIDKESLSSFQIIAQESPVRAIVTFEYLVDQISTRKQTEFRYRFGDDWKQFIDLA